MNWLYLLMGVVMLLVGTKSVLLETLLELVEKVKRQHDFVSDPTDLDDWVEDFLRMLHESEG